MVYKVIGLMSGSSLDGLDIAYVHLHVSAGKWEYSFVKTACYPYSEEWRRKLADAPGLSALEYQLLHTDYGHYLGAAVNKFIQEHQLHYQVQLIASHGHTTFHIPARKMTGQLGDGAALAAETGINVVSDLRAMDLALGGQGAPIVPIGEKLLLPGYKYFLNLGGIANITTHLTGRDGSVFVAFDVCPSSRVLDSLAALAGKRYDEGGMLTASGKIDSGLLAALNGLPYYKQGYPKSLANDFGTDTVYPMIMAAGLSTEDALRTYTEHIAVQISESVAALKAKEAADGAKSGTGAATDVAKSGTDVSAAGTEKLIITGGGGHNTFLTTRIRELLSPLQVEVVVPDKELVDFKEALVMALIGALRWREENNVLSSVTGASRNSIGGAVWIGQEA